MNFLEKYYSGKTFFKRSLGPLGHLLIIPWKFNVLLTNWTLWPTVFKLILSVETGLGLLHHIPYVWTIPIQSFKQPAWCLLVGKQNYENNKNDILQWVEVKTKDSMPGTRLFLLLLLCPLITKCQDDLEVYFLPGDYEDYIKMTRHPGVTDFSELTVCLRWPYLYLVVDY